LELEQGEERSAKIHRDRVSDLRCQVRCEEIEGVPGAMECNAFAYLSRRHMSKSHVFVGESLKSACFQLRLIPPPPSLWNIEV